MDLYQSAKWYNSHFQGFNQKTGVPSVQMAAQPMQYMVMLAAQSDMPSDGRLLYLDQIVGQIAEVAPRSAQLFNQLIVDSPEQKELVKSLEIAMAVLAERSPETLQHIMHHTALTMLYYERQNGLNNPDVPVQTEEMLTLLIGALGHDIGKTGLDPKLLHKSTRVDQTIFSTALQNYKALVPYYPEKLHDLIFLEKVNNGEIIFSSDQANASGAGIIKDIGKDLHRSEEYWLKDDERLRHNAIWQRISTHAESYIVPAQNDGWFTAEEQQALTLAQRGTVTPVEMKIIESHDVMSEAFFAAAPLAPALKGVRDIVSMDRFRNANIASQKNSPLSDIIHATDVFEALTANRSYRKPYSPEEALAVMEGMARAGKVSGAITTSMKNNGTIDIYANNVGLEHSVEPVVMPPHKPTWVERIFGLRSINLSPKQGFVSQLSSSGYQGQPMLRS